MIESLAYQTLDVVYESPRWIFRGSSVGRTTNSCVKSALKADNRRDGRLFVLVLQNLNSAVFLVDAYAGVGRSQIYANNWLVWLNHLFF